MLTVHELTGGYSRVQPVIHDLSFDVKPGEMVGLIGLNGAGKSTTIKHILGLMTPVAGKVTLHGKTLQDDPSTFRSQIAYIPETPQFYEELTLWEHLELTIRAYRLDKAEASRRAHDLLEQFRMDKAKHWFPHTFSKGMQQKIMILCAFLAQPALLIVDEPFVGLDPLAIQALLDLLQEGKQQGMGILISTHILDMAEKYCDRFILLHDGRIRLKGDLPAMQHTLNKPGASLEQLFIQVVKG
jgi:ABC-2 type transport system ATP-binding protein